jgi:hypothetical protein
MSAEHRKLGVELFEDAKSVRLEVFQDLVSRAGCLMTITPPAVWSLCLAEVFRNLVRTCNLDRVQDFLTGIQSLGAD